jgi:RepB DNA-primase from phage plasmid
MMPASAAPTVAASRAPREEHTTQLAALYADTAGFVVLACIDGDPRPNCGGIYDQHVFRWPSERHHVERQARAWAERGLNVYCSLVVLRGKQRTYAHALDSPWIWLDDLDHVPTDAAMAVETSPGNFQVYWKLNEALGARERAALQRRACAHYAVDACSADAVHLVRLAGGYNRKRHGMFKVRLVRHTDSTVTRAELEARWPKAGVGEDEVDPIALDQEQLALWNGNLRALLDEHNLPRRWINPHIPGRQVLRGELAAHDRSTQRYIVVKSLILHGYPDAEIATLAAVLTDNGHSREKGTDWLYLDIARCIAKAEQELARKGRARRITPTLLVPHCPSLPVEQVEPHRRRGRPIGGRARKIARLRTVLMERAEDDASGRIYYYVDDLAEALGASRRSTQEYLAELEAGGELRRGQDGRKNMAWIELSPACYEHERGANNWAIELPGPCEVCIAEPSQRSALNSTCGAGQGSADDGQERSANNSIDTICGVAQDSAGYVQERSANNNALCRVVEGGVGCAEERSASN